MNVFRTGFLSSIGYHRRSDMANSPFHTNILNTEERRSRLFPDKRRIPGRKAKCLLVVGMLLQIWGIRKIVEIRRFFRKRDMEIKKQQRKTAPFFQAMADLRYCSLKERNDILMNELFAHKGQDYIKRITQRFNQTDIWAPFAPRYGFMHLRTARNIKPYHEIWLSRYLHNYDVYNI